MKKIIIPIALVAALAAAYFVFFHGGDRLPNIILVTCDTLRADRLHLYGNPRETSPNLDALAKESVVFDHFYANSSFTPPSHASILTGRYVRSHGILWWDSSLSPGVKTIAELLGTPKGSTTGAGYNTGAFVNLENFRKLGLTRGFEHVRSRTWFTGEDLTKDFFEWFDAQKDGRPVCSWLHYWDPHRPYAYREWQYLRPPPNKQKSESEIAAMPEIDRDIYKRSFEAGARPMFTFNETLYGKGSPGVGRMDYHYDRPVKDKDNSYFVPGEPTSRPFTDDDNRFLIDRFDGGVKYTDQWLGALVDGLRERGALDHTLLIITGDHGESFTERDVQYFAHDPYLYEEVTRVPCIIRFPAGEFGGTRVANLGQSVDLLPTVFEYIGLSNPPQLQGSSLIDITNVRSLASRQGDFVYAQTQGKLKNEATGKFELAGKQFAVRSANKRLIAAPLAGGHWNLEYYDLSADPGEKKNLHAKPALAEEELLLKELQSWLGRIPSPPTGDRDMTDEEIRALITGGYIKK
ncbi:MAG: sulfatase [Planctomycetes bacterium]|nr:sulfatase [Planctomycetota bacterium]